MDNKFRREIVAFCDFCITGCAPVQAPAFGKQPRAGSTVDRSIDPTTSKKRIIRCIYNCINLKPGNVAFYNFDKFHPFYDEKIKNVF
jgi:hypothetical protein